MNSDALDRLDKIEERLRSIFEDVWPENPRYTLPALYDRVSDVPANSRRPSTDIIDDEDALRIIAELPGVKKEDVDVQIKDHYLKISAKTTSEQEIDKDLYLRRERQTHQFFRRIRLPTTIDPTNAAASFKNGILELELPKADNVKTHKLKVN